MHDGDTYPNMTEMNTDAKMSESCSNNYKQYTLDYILSVKDKPSGQGTESQDVSFDDFLHHWRLSIPLDNERLWFLSVFVDENGSTIKYSLDEEASDDSHYEFEAESDIRETLYLSGDEDRYFHEILTRYVKANGGEALLNLIMPYVTAQHHYY